MPEPKLLGYGAWRSPITSDLIVAETIGLSQVQVSGDETYWVESRPSERGRNVIVRRSSDGTLEDVNPAPFNARTRVHEYGGGAYLPGPDGIFFTRFEDQMIYKQTAPGGVPQQVTAVEKLRFADGVYDAARNRIISVCEDHRAEGAEARNYLVSISLADHGKIHTLVEGADFYASPTLSPDGKHLAWMSWNHPSMPWGSSELWMSEVDDEGQLISSRKVAGGVDESVFQPLWSPEGVLYFVWDKQGWWNLYRLAGEKVEAVCPAEAEFGRPQWTFGLSTYGFGGDGHIICSYTRNGLWELARVDVGTGQLDTIKIPYSTIFDLSVTDGRVVIIAGAPDLPTAVVEVELSTGAHKVLRKASTIALDAKYVSTPEPVEFKTTNGKTAYALFYPPKNDDFPVAGDELPPLIIKVHGGPTSATTSALNLNTQFWTSRGFAVVDVNYGGSTGYGREYRDRLKESWGVVDLDDCVNAALHLAEVGRVDKERMAISGGSAGGYTALCALTFRNVLSAGTSLYGISDLEALVRDTHKFESRYPFWLIGPYPEAKELYYQRSPVHFAERIQSPVLFLQGEEDEVVPPNQTELMAGAMLAGKKPFGLIMFAGEQHGFRKADSIRRALDAELNFFSILLTRTGLRF